MPNEPAATALRTAVRAATDTPGVINISASPDRVICKIERPADTLEFSPSSARSFARKLLTFANVAERK